MHKPTAGYWKGQVPFLIIHGSKDCLAFPRLKKESCADVVPHATMREIDGMGHMILNNDLWKQIEKLLIDFI